MNHIRYIEYNAVHNSDFVFDLPGGHDCWLRFDSTELSVCSLPIQGRPFPLPDFAYFHQLFQLLTWEHSLPGQNSHRVIDQLRYTNRTIQEIAELCGYNHVEHFCRQFHRQTGQTPKAYRTLISESSL